MRKDNFFAVKNEIIDLAKSPVDRFLRENVLHWKKFMEKTWRLLWNALSWDKSESATEVAGAKSKSMVKPKPGQASLKKKKRKEKDLAEAICTKGPTWKYVSNNSSSGNENWKTFFYVWSICHERLKLANSAMPDLWVFSLHCRNDKCSY